MRTLETLDAIKRAEDFGYLTHDEAVALAKKAFGLEVAVPQPEVQPEVTPEVSGETVEVPQ